MMMAECSAAFERLPCLKGADILRNILYAGVWNRYNKIRKERQNTKAGSGRNEHASDGGAHHAS